ncbi:MAG: hypothetical protein ACOVSW_15170 [Candidatus Kapaibacteriota bacterium]
MLQASQGHIRGGGLMAFAQFKTLAEVLSQFSITYSKESVSQASVNILPSDTLREQIAFAIDMDIYKTSEYARCESLIFPILQEVWKAHLKSLRLWSHVPIAAEEPLTGTPDYLIAQASPLGNIVLGKPILAAVEAKRENFDEGWAQCTAEMLAIQHINQDSMRVWGVVTNGELWQFGALDGRLLRQEATFYTVRNLDELFGVLSFIMAECARQITVP